MAESDSIPRRDLIRSAAAAGLVVAIGSGADDPPRKAVAARAKDVGTIEDILSAVL